MPALSQEEMATILDPTPNQRLVEDVDDALRSQLLANLEQNKLANAANNLLSPRKSRPVQDGATADGNPSVASSVSEISAQAIEDEEEGEDVLSAAGSESDQDEDENDEEDEDEDVTMQEPGATSIHDDSEAQEDTSSPDQADNEDDMAEEEVDTAAERAPTELEPDEEEYEDATSTMDATEPNAAALSDTESEAVPGASKKSDHFQDSDNDVDLCLFCGQQDAPDEPSDIDLICSVCRRPAHPSCARSKGMDIADPKSWRCSACADKNSLSPQEMLNKPRHSAPRLVRDLLPVSRGVQKPGAHSIFAQPLIQDDDGGRALRKRKSDTDERTPRPDKPRKKIKETPQPQKSESDAVSHSTRRVSQKLTTAFPPPPTARILQHRPFHKPPPHKFILAFRLDQEKIAAIVAEPPKPNRRRYLKKKQKIPAPPTFQPPVPKFPALPAGHLIFPSMFGDREHDTNAKPYGGILQESEADTSRSLPQMRDREIFEIARKEAEEERKKTSAKAEAEINGLTGEGANATNSKRTVSGPPSKIKCIQFGKYVIDTSYAAPYPEEYSHESRLFICEFCLKYLPSEFVAWRHKLKCPAKHPPGDEIYRDGSLSIWEVDGRKKTEYCQCLCLMAKLFLGSKTLYYDVDPFLFYILTEYDEFGYHFVGYFSKEKRPASQNNVSCILVLPIHQRKGYATFLIEFSYLLTRLEGKEGSPEKPLSDMGLTAYRSYWDLTISKHLLELGDKPFSIKDIMLMTGMTADDVVHSLERLYAFIKDPVTKSYAIRYDKKLYDNIVDKYESKDFRQIRPERLVWTPYIMGRSDAANLDAQPITAVAQREEDAIDAQPEDDLDRISPKTQDPVQHSPSKNVVDPALVNDNGNIAPGPPSTDAMPDSLLTSSESKDEDNLPNGVEDGEHAPGEQSLTGYALMYQTEKIPPNRFQIDPPIPAAMLRYAKSRRKSLAGTPKTNGRASSKPATPQAVRSSPRKAASTNGSVAGRGSSRASSPDKGSTSVRRSGRRSGLANEIVTTDATEEDEDEEEEEEDEDEEDDDEEDAPADEDIEDEDVAKVATTLDTTGVNSAETSSAEDEEASDRSDASSSGDDREDEDDDEESNASDDLDAEVDDEEDDSNGEEGDEDDEDEDAEIDIPSAVSSVAVSEAGSESSGQDDDDEEEEEED